jgi:sporulation protein YlmC with PRC-barrel domain
MGDSRLTIADPSLDVDGFRVLDDSGREMGVVDDYLIDEWQEKVRYLQVSSGGFLGLGARRFLLPVENIVHIGQGTLHVDANRVAKNLVPFYDPELADEIFAEEGLYDPVYGSYDYSGSATRTSRMEDFSRLNNSSHRNHRNSTNVP